MRKFLEIWGTCHFALLIGTVGTSLVMAPFWGVGFLWMGLGELFGRNLLLEDGASQLASVGLGSACVIGSLIAIAHTPTFVIAYFLDRKDRKRERSDV